MHWDIMENRELPPNVEHFDYDTAILIEYLYTALDGRYNSSITRADLLRRLKARWFTLQHEYFQPGAAYKQY